VDKTGTLTEGKPTLTRIVPAEGIDERRLLQWAAALEAQSEHPLASAVVRAAKERGIPPETVTVFQSVPGGGVTGKIAGEPVVVGQASLLQTFKIDGLDPLLPDARRLQEDGNTVIYVAIAGRASGLLALSDPIKPSAPEAIAALHRMGLKIVMLTGDNAATAHQIAERLGIDEVHAGVSPTEKQKHVASLKAGGRRVAMAGDGVNDAPALAAADVGIAMGTGTDVAMESAGVTLVQGDLRGIVSAIALSRATMRNIRQNLLFAFLYNSLGIPIAAGILYPAFGLLLNPMIASAAMALSSVSVIGNALRLRTR